MVLLKLALGDERYLRVCLRGFQPIIRLTTYDKPAFFLDELDFARLFQLREVLPNHMVGLDVTYGVNSGYSALRCAPNEETGCLQFEVENVPNPSSAEGRTHRVLFTFTEESSRSFVAQLPEIKECLDSVRRLRSTIESMYGCVQEEMRHLCNVHVGVPSLEHFNLIKDDLLVSTRLECKLLGLEERCERDPQSQVKCLPYLIPAIMWQHNYMYAVLYPQCFEINV